VVSSDAAHARSIGRLAVPDPYLSLRNYTNNLLREGFTPGDIANEGSDKLIDPLVLHGSPGHHENIGVQVDNDLVAVRTIITGTHSGDYAGVPATGASIQTSASHVFRMKDDKLAEHWLIVDTYRILVALGAIPGVANAFQQILGVAESPGGLFPERLGTRFDAPAKRHVASEESRSAVRRLYDGVFTTGNIEDVDAVAEGTFRTPAGPPTAETSSPRRWRSAAAPCPTGWPCRHTS